MNIRQYLRSYSSTATLTAVLLGTASPCLAQSAPAAATSTKTANPETIVEEVVVSSGKSIPGGLMKEQVAAETMSSITPAAIAEKLAAGSPLELASTIPGVNFGSSDPYGLSVRNFMSVRGLDQTELGFMIEGVPGTDLISYYPYSEAWADNENISDITLTPGNSRLQDPIISASGGEFIETIRQPRNTFGGMASASVGSYDGWRTFVDLDTGYISATPGPRPSFPIRRRRPAIGSGLAPTTAIISISKWWRIGRRRPIPACSPPIITG